MGNLGKFEMLKKDFLESLPEEKLKLLKKMSAYSSCLTDFLFRHTEELDFLFEELDKPLYGRDKLVEEALELIDISSNNDFSVKLAFFKMKHLGRIFSKDIYKKHSLSELLEEYSYLADASFEAAYKRAFEKNKKRYGQPLKPDGSPASGSVIALGKMGGLELNYYSDVDVMYIYDDEGKTEKGISNREFFISVFRDTTNYLTKKTFEGQSWIVDLDLRPEGKKGFIAYSLPALEYYYWTHGRTWERHMLIKARHSAGNSTVSKQFLDIITPFVYRRSTGEEVFEEIVEMKRMITEEAKKKKIGQWDVKRGEGGIREIEFFTQILLLLYGGKNPDLRERNLLRALEKLAQHKIISKDTQKTLKEAYIFYRNLEHIIQMENCVQTQTFFMEKAEEYASKMGFSSTKEFLDTLENHRKKVQEIFNQLTPSIDRKLTPLQKYILTKQNEEDAISYLEQLGFKDGKWAVERFKDIFFSKEYIELGGSWKEDLFMYIPVLEKKLKEFPDREDFLLNLTKLFIEGKMLRIFAAALEQNQKLVEFMLSIAKLSDYISDLMAKDTELLDWAFGIEEVPVDREGFEKELAVIGDKLEPVDRLKKLKKIVEVLTSLKYLSRIHEESSKERLKELNTALSNLADFILENLYEYIEGENFAIFALGKLGSREMNIGSDLDLIFVFVDESSKNRLISKPATVVKLLTSYSKEGILYQLDLRLRPFGKAGELAPTLNFYKNYFEKEARPWEKLAWTKARFIAGDKSVAEKMENLIKDFLFSEEITKDFIDNIFEMRLSLEGLVKELPSEIDIKLGKGGITDIEFLAQLAILKSRKRETNILSVVEKEYSNLLENYIFLREV
ncbi:MAG: glutamine-synthetase adenylyltransferase, partial [Aquificae bacterium]|nr:glutamine-synthetase adenylyltransferase [Aquificota bacterium]